MRCFTSSAAGLLAALAFVAGARTAAAADKHQHAIAKSPASTSIKCGDGTILVYKTCVLDPNVCGPGTTLDANGPRCVLIGSPSLPQSVTSLESLQAIADHGAKEGSVVNSESKKKEDDNSKKMIKPQLIVTEEAQTRPAGAGVKDPAEKQTELSNMMEKGNKKSILPLPNPTPFAPTNGFSGSDRNIAMGHKDGAKKAYKERKEKKGLLRGMDEKANALDGERLRPREQEKVSRLDHTFEVEKVFITVDPTDNDTTCDIFNKEKHKPCMSKLNVNMKLGKFTADTKEANAVMGQRGKGSLQAGLKSYHIGLKTTGTQAFLWHGQRHLNLNKHPFDASKIRNKLSFDLLASVPHLESSRTRFVQLFVDHHNSQGFEDHGLYTHVEQPDELFLKNRNLDPEGDLYAAEQFEFYRYPDKLKAINDPTYSKFDFEKVLLILNGGDDHTALLNMLDSVNDHDQDFDTVFKKHFDEDNFLAWLAANILLDNVDTMSQNFSLYRPSESTTFYFLPWDYDGAFDFARKAQPGGRRRHFRPRVRTGIATWWNNQLIQRFLKQEGAVNRLTAKVRELYAKQLNPLQAQTLIDSYMDFIHPFICSLEHDSSCIIMDAEIAPLPGVINASYQNFLHSLERPMPIFLAAERIGDIVEFRWTPSYHLMGRAVTYDLEISTSPMIWDTTIFLKLVGLVDTYKHVEALGGLPKGDIFFRVIVRDVYKPEENWQYAFDWLEARYEGIQKFVVPTTVPAGMTPTNANGIYSNDDSTIHPEQQDDAAEVAKPTLRENDTINYLDSTQRIHIALLSDRAQGSAVVLSSVCLSTELSNDRLVFHIFGYKVLHLKKLTDGLPSCAGAHFNFMSVSDATEDLLRQGFRPFWATSDLKGKKIDDDEPGEWAVTTPFTHDKHASPLNILRFYLPYLPLFANVDKVIFLDDDIVVQKDISQLYHLDAKPGKALLTGCQHWYWSPEDNGRFKSTYNRSVRDSGYIGNLNSICGEKDTNDKNCVRNGIERDLEALSLALDKYDFPSFAGRPLERQAFNMGVNVIQTEAWRAAKLSHRFEQVVEANTNRRLFPEDTLAFGIGLGYFAVGDAFECYDDKISHIVGLSFVDQEALDAEGFTLPMIQKDGFALHFNGANKPWEKNHDKLCGSTPIQTTSDIWLKACIDSMICTCKEVPAQKTHINLEESSHFLRQLHSGGHDAYPANEYVHPDDLDGRNGSNNDNIFKKKKKEKKKRKRGRKGREKKKEKKEKRKGGKKRARGGVQAVSKPSSYSHSS